MSSTLSDSDIQAIRGCYVRGSTKEDLAEIWRISLADIEKATAGLEQIAILRKGESR